MDSPKLTFSLVYLGAFSEDRHMVHFKVHSMDSRFLGCRYVARNGWVVVSSHSVEFRPDDHRIYLLGSGATLTTRDIYSFRATSVEDAQRILQQVIEALQEWAASASCFQTGAFDPAISPEVRDSLLALGESPDEEEGDEGPAPIFLDELSAPKITLR